MNCQEVMELMQRYVDGDLDEQETSLMMDHTGQCPDCAAMLVRLQKLSSELEQLPRVVPKFSIVDSIMPELERLHIEATDEGQETSGSRDASPAPIRSNRPSRHLFGKVAGTVAAGVIAGLLLFGHPDQWLLSGSKGSNDASAPSLAAAPAKNESSSLMSKRSSELDMSDQSGGTGETGSASNADSGNSIAGAMGIAPEANPSSVERPTLTTGDESKISGFTVASEQAESPDGKWSAVAGEEAQTFKIVKIEDGSVIYSSQPLEGTIGSLEWNDTSTILYYTVTDAQGNQTNWQFDLAASKESKR
ncbi:anti-sigma factor family protein [Cohnella terricola]|uniref:Anti-sigma-W factor RsiW n=1 Tax=Cohnella terricola TaxID=1289167 RepID=A0A559JKU9_9BACL|nr:zf-HC2 domain-containing protein [Cohnella terricola]TVY00498.1 hypothetical protein FPZ45_10745 [Cohnella terricola]